MEQQESQEVCACSFAGCSEVFADTDSVALHWAEPHGANATIEEARQALEADPERFRFQLAQILAEINEEESNQQLTYREPEDGYVIHHSPNVPRVRSRPTEHVVYIERESVGFIDRELEELFEREGCDLEEDPPRGEIWGEGRQQTIAVELRFCNILDGYIPLVKDVRGILPPLRDGEAIEMAWQDTPDNWFPCKVSRSKRAIYNPQGRFKDIFRAFPSGVRLCITRVAARLYQLEIKRQPHVVPN